MPASTEGYPETAGSNVSSLFGIVQYPGTDRSKLPILWGRIDDAIREYCGRNPLPIVLSWRSLVLWLLSGDDA